MTQHFRYTTLVLLTTLSTVYASAQSLRKLMEMPPRIIESKWEQTPEGGTELNYYNGDLCSYYLFRENDRSYNLNPGKNTVFRIEKGSNASNSFKTSSRYMFFRGPIPQRLSDQYSLCTSCKDRRRNTMADRSSGICQNYDIPNSGRRHRLCNPQRSRLCDSAATAIVDIPPRPYLCRLPYDASKLHPDG